MGCERGSVDVLLPASSPLKLNSLFGQQAKDATLFRNPNGVYMKLAKFRAVDPLHTSQGKRGLSRGGHGVAELWEEFSTRVDELKLNGLHRPLRGN